MSDLAPWLAVAGVCVILAAGAVGVLRYLAAGRRRTVRAAAQAGFIGPATELFHPAAFRAQVYREEQAEVREADALPGDPPLGDGHVVVHLR